MRYVHKMGDVLIDVVERYYPEAAEEYRQYVKNVTRVADMLFRRGRVDEAMTYIQALRQMSLDVINSLDIDPNERELLKRDIDGYFENVVRELEKKARPVL